MPADQHRIGIWILFHCLLETFREILLERRVVDDGDPERVVIPEHAFARAPRNALDLLNVADFKVPTRTKLALDKKGHQDSPLRVGVNAAAGAAVEGGQEQGRAGRGFQILGFANIVSRRRRILWSRILQHKEILGLNQLLLDSRRCNVDVISVPNGSLSIRSNISSNEAKC